MSKKTMKQNAENLEPTTSIRVQNELSEVHQYLREPALLGQVYGRPGIRAFLNSKTVVMSSWAAAMCGFLYGYDQGQMNVTLNMEHFLSKFPEIDAEANGKAAFWKGLVTAIFELGAVIGALQSAFWCDRISRRYTIFVATFWYLAGAVVQSAATNYAMMVVGRFIGGIGVGGASMVAPLYIAEIAQPNIRGALYTLQQWMLILGIVAAYYTTYGARFIDNSWSWRTSFVAQILPGLILTGLVYFLPFSPRWLSMKGRNQECLATLARLRQLPESDPRVQAEGLIIRTEVLLQQRLAGLDSDQSRSCMRFVSTQLHRWKLCFTKRYIKRIAISIILNAFQQWVGVNGFTYYSTQLFAELGYDYEMRLTLGGLLSVTQAVAAIVPIFIIDHFGRRPLLLVGTFTLMACHAITGACIGTSYTDWASNQPSAKAGTAFMFIYMFAFEVSWGPIAWGLPSEILPSAVRAEGMAFAAASNWASNFIVGLIVPAIVKTAPYASFALFACTSFVALVWVYFFIPETKQKTLEELSGIFNDGATEEEKNEREAIITSILDEHQHHAV